LALLFGEPGAGLVADAIAADAVIRTVNLAEVATVLVRRDQDPGQVLAPVRAQLPVAPFTDQDAIVAAALYPRTSGKGLSLGGRAGVALTHRLSGSALTAEHAWAELDVGVDVQLIRPRTT
jgi:PIN domain nuclease of toxin-antitoxin system